MESKCLGTSWGRNPKKENESKGKSEGGKKVKEEAKEVSHSALVEAGHQAVLQQARKQAGVRARAVALKRLRALHPEEYRSFKREALDRDPPRADRNIPEWRLVQIGGMELQRRKAKLLKDRARREHLRRAT